MPIIYRPLQVHLSIRSLMVFPIFFFSFSSLLFSFSVCYFPELEEQPTNAKELPWVAFYCVLKQDEQAFTTYCSEEFSVSLNKTKKTQKNITKHKLK